MAMTKLTLEQEEILSFQVKKYPCLFDKSDKGYKEKDCVGNAFFLSDFGPSYVRLAKKTVKKRANTRHSVNVKQQIKYL